MQKKILNLPLLCLAMGSVPCQSARQGPSGRVPQEYSSEPRDADSERLKARVIDAIHSGNISSLKEILADERFEVGGFSCEYLTAAIECGNKDILELLLILNDIDPNEGSPILKTFELDRPDLALPIMEHQRFCYNRRIGKEGYPITNALRCLAYPRIYYSGDERLKSDHGWVVHKSHLEQWQSLFSLGMSHTDLSIKDSRGACIFHEFGFPYPNDTPRIFPNKYIQEYLNAVSREDGKSTILSNWNKSTSAWEGTCGNIVSRSLCFCMLAPEGSDIDKKRAGDLLKYFADQGVTFEGTTLHTLVKSADNEQVAEVARHILESDAHYAGVSLSFLLNDRFAPLLKPWHYTAELEVWECAMEKCERAFFGKDDSARRAWYRLGPLKYSQIQCPDSLLKKLIVETSTDECPPLEFWKVPVFLLYQHNLADLSKDRGGRQIQLTVKILENVTQCADTLDKLGPVLDILKLGIDPSLPISYQTLSSLFSLLEIENPRTKHWVDRTLMDILKNPNNVKIASNCIDFWLYAASKPELWDGMANVKIPERLLTSECQFATMLNKFDSEVERLELDLDGYIIYSTFPHLFHVFEMTSDRAKPWVNERLMRILNTPKNVKPASALIEFWLYAAGQPALWDKLGNVKIPVWLLTHEYQFATILDKFAPSFEHVKLGIDPNVPISYDTLSHLYSLLKRATPRAKVWVEETLMDILKNPNNAKIASNTIEFWLYAADKPELLSTVDVNIPMSGWGHVTHSAEAIRRYKMVISKWLNDPRRKDIPIDALFHLRENLDAFEQEEQQIISSHLQAHKEDIDEYAARIAKALGAIVGRGV
ncbi:MAG: hypothetical protein LBR89_00025 [Holosporales bacterium]|jgi:hypothetical protein|nr:hypothetical protein [Holosporales bacterium]